MAQLENRRAFIHKLGLISIGVGSGVTLPFTSSGSHSILEKSFKTPPQLKSLSPDKIFSVIDLDRPELAKVRNTLNQNGYAAALQTLLNYYRRRYSQYSNKPGQADIENKSKVIKRAKNLEDHIFQWGPYQPHDYGKNINWAADPAGDIEWVAAIYRWYWADDLKKAYLATGNNEYVATFVELAKDWIKKHPLEETLNEMHPVYGPGKYGENGWKGYAWLDIQTGIRAQNLCDVFPLFVHANPFTPEFLGILLASVYDHQVKTEQIPKGRIHNKAIFEQMGFIKVIHTFPEFKDKERWLDLAMDRTYQLLLGQTTTDGVQREWCGGYHTGVYRDAMEIDKLVRDLGRPIPEGFQHRMWLMAEHIFWISTPELGFPMFGDTKRKPPKSDDRSTWELYDVLVEATNRFNDPKYKALADLEENKLPKNGSKAFTEAGLYAMRSNWTPDQVYMAVHCSQPAISSHDTPDNGTFEIYGHGQWLMPDSGYYTYGHDPEARAWHRQTKVHATLTVDGQDTQKLGRHLLWQSNENQDILCVENQSYDNLLHRRTIWFADKKGAYPFFVMMDEAIGYANGNLELRFPMAPGPVNVENDTGRITTGLEEANLLIQTTCNYPLTLHKEKGWHAWDYGKRERRTMVNAKCKAQKPVVFISVLVPYPGKDQPECQVLTDPTTLFAGINPVKIEVEVAGQRHQLGRKIKMRK